jgi:hypothetical protein
MLTGTETLMRGSTAARMNVCVPPPDAPVQPRRSASTSGSEQRKSTTLREFQSWRPSRLTAQGLSSSWWGSWVVSAYPTMS